MPKKKEEIANNEAVKEKNTKSGSGKAHKDDAGVSSELEHLKDELKSVNDSLLRLAAEYDNYRRRSQKEKEQSYTDSRAIVLTELLPVLDNFDRALGNSTGDIEAYKKGVEMTSAQLTGILAKLGLESFGARGDTFDPNMHNAVMSIEDSELEENTVASVFSKGYKIGEKVIRCADVQVTA